MIHGAHVIIYSKDSALGVYLATMADKVPSRVYNIGSGEGLTLNDMAAAVPASLLQSVAPKVTWILDESAGRDLPRRQPVGP